MPKEICKIEKCTGCFSCMNICPQDAITVGEDINGKTIPYIDKKKCIECGKCVRVCPVNYPVNFYNPRKCYAAWEKNEEDRRTSASGGIAAALSKVVIEENGIVYGAGFNEKLELVHSSARNIEEIQKFKGSKYVQSYTGLIFRHVKENLENNKKILFIGTPCQVAGLKSYLGKGYDNLILVDIICHGTPPMSYLKEYLKFIDPKCRADKVTFRGEKDFCMTLYHGTEEFYCTKSEKDFYFYAFLKGLIYRDNCYTCSWAKPDRCSDITIGDFWGLDRKSMKEQYSGKVSVVLLNTLTGEQFWEKHRSCFYSEQREVKEAVDGNAQLRKPSKYHADRTLFLNNYKKGNFIEAVKTPRMKISIKINIIKDSAPYRVARKIKKILRQ